MYASITIMYATIMPRPFRAFISRFTFISYLLGLFAKAKPSGVTLNFAGLSIKLSPGTPRAPVVPYTPVSCQ